MLNIEIVYGDTHKQKIYQLIVNKNCSARQAVAQHTSVILLDFPHADLTNAPLGVFGKIIKDDYILQEYDRIEIYRPLLINPKEARRRRAQKI